MLYIFLFPNTQNSVKTPHWKVVYLTVSVVLLVSIAGHIRSTVLYKPTKLESEHLIGRLCVLGGRGLRDCEWICVYVCVALLAHCTCNEITCCTVSIVSRVSPSHKGDLNSDNIDLLICQYISATPVSHYG